MKKDQINKAWIKMELNSIYGFPKISSIEMYNEEKALKITEEGKCIINNLTV
jgi:hypothetical protein